MRILVTTPTGNVGSRVVQRLLEAGADVSVLARDPARLPDEVRARATIHTGSLESEDDVRRAAAGADALFLLVPPDYATEDWSGFQRGIGRSAAEAVRANGIGRVVFLSSFGAHRGDLFAISRLGEVEEMLRDAAPHVLALRAGFFAENFLSAVPTLKDHGGIYMPLSPDAVLPIVATRDLGDAAADALLDASWSGHEVRGVHGAADLSMAEAAAILGRVLGREVRYVQASEEQARDALLAMGASAHVAGEYARMFVTLDRHADDHEPRNPRTTTPTTLEEWAAEVLRPLVQEGQPAAV